MVRRAGDSSKSHEAKISLADLRDYVEDWNLEGQLRQHTSQSVVSRQAKLAKFFWFLQYKNIQAVGTTELKQFLLYCAEGHNQPGGRWGNPKLTAPMRPVTLHGYYRILKALFNYLVNEEVIEVSPMQRVKPPAVRIEVKQPVSDEHVKALLRACKHSTYSRRDTAILLLLLDTGIRASELCGLRVEDLDLGNHTLKVLGKGNKYRTVFLGLSATKALTVYLRNKNRQPHDPLFLSHTHKQFTNWGVFQVMKRLASTACIPNPGVHALRRTFAVNMIKAGANVFTVQMLMGHTDITMTRRYCKVAEADCAEQHRQFSPGDRFKSK